MSHGAPEFRRMARAVIGNDGVPADLGIRLADTFWAAKIDLGWAEMRPDEQIDALATHLAAEAAEKSRPPAQTIETMPSKAIDLALAKELWPLAARIAAAIETMITGMREKA
jgi:hypothetical protein